MTRAAELLPSLGYEICPWIETFLCLGPGDVQGGAWVLDDEERAFVWRCYELYPKTHHLAGRRAHPEALYSRPKGRRKSMLAAGIVWAEALAPVRFAGWRRNKPIGRPVTGPVVKIFATEEGQTGNTYDGVKFMGENGTLGDEYPDLDIGKHCSFGPGGMEIGTFTAAADSKEGGRESLVVFDETALYVTPELVELHATVTSNLRKRKLGDPWALQTSIMYRPGTGPVDEKGLSGSVAERTHKAAMMPGSRILLDHRQAPDDTDIDDDVSLRAGLTYVYGSAAQWTNIDGIIADEFRNPMKSEAENRRKWLNQPHKGGNRYFDPLILGDLADPERKIGGKAPVLLAFDGSRGDRVALIGWSIESRPHRFTVGLWGPPERAPESWRLDRAEVADRVAWAMQQWKVRLFIAVPRGWFSEIQAWEQLYGDEKLRPFVVFATNQPKRMAEACSRFDSALTGKTFTTDGDPVVDQHLYNCVKKTTTWGDIVSRGPGDEPIDAGVCTIVGWFGLSLLPPEKKKRTRVIDLAAALAADEEKRAAAEEAKEMELRIAGIPGVEH